MPSILKTLVATAIAFICITSNTPLSSVLADSVATSAQNQVTHRQHHYHSGGANGGGGGGGFIAEIDNAIDADATVDEAVVAPVSAPLNARQANRQINGGGRGAGRWAKPITPSTALLFHDKMITRLNERLASETDPAKQAQLRAKIAKVTATKQKISDHIAANGDVPITPQQMRSIHQAVKQSSTPATAMDAIDAEVNDAVDATLDDATSSAPANPTRRGGGGGRGNGRWSQPIAPSAALQMHDKILTRLNTRLASETDPAAQAKLQAKIAKLTAIKQKLSEHIAANGDAPISIKAFRQAAKQSSATNSPPAATAMDAIDATEAEVNDASGEFDDAALDDAIPATPAANSRSPRIGGAGGRGNGRFSKPVTPSAALRMHEKILTHLNERLASETDPAVQAQIQAKIAKLTAIKQKLSDHIAANGDAPISMRALHQSAKQSSPTNPPAATAMDAIDAATEAEVDDASGELDEATTVTPSTLPRHPRGFGPKRPIDPQQALARTQSVISELNAKIAASTDPAVTAKLQDQLNRMEARKGTIEEHIATNGNTPIPPSKMRPMNGGGMMHHMGFGPVDPQKALAAHDKMIQSLTAQIAAESDPQKKELLQHRLARCQTRKDKIQQLISTNGNKPITRDQMKGMMVDSSSQPTESADAMEAIDSTEAAQIDAATPADSTSVRTVDPQKALARLDKMISTISRRASAATGEMQTRLRRRLTRIQARKDKIQQYISTHGNTPLPADQMKTLMRPQQQRPAPRAMELDEVTNEVQSTPAAPSTPTYTEEQLNAVLPTHVHVRVELDD